MKFKFVFLSVSLIWVGCEQPTLKPKSAIIDGTLQTRLLTQLPMNRSKEPYRATETDVDHAFNGKSSKMSADMKRTTVEITEMYRMQREFGGFNNKSTVDVKAYIEMNKNKMGGDKFAQYAAMNILSDIYGDNATSLIDDISNDFRPKLSSNQQQKAIYAVQLLSEYGNPNTDVIANVLLDLGTNIDATTRARVAKKALAEAERNVTRQNAGKVIQNRMLAIERSIPVLADLSI